MKNLSLFIFTGILCISFGCQKNNTNISIAKTNVSVDPGPGHPEKLLIENITLENITIAGKKVESFDDIPVFVNKFTKNIRIIP